MSHLARAGNQATTKVKQKNIAQNISDKEITFTKELNSMGYFIIGLIYTVIVVLVTAKYLSKSNTSQQQLVSTDIAKEEIIDEIHRLSLAKERSIGPKELQNQLEKFREDLIVEVNRMNLKYVEMIEKNKKKQSVIIPTFDESERSLASIPDGAKTLKYNDVNRKLIRFKHNREFERKKEELAKEKQALLEKLDLSKYKDQKKWEAFNDKVDYALYELKQKHKALESEFRQKQYIVMEE